jgi:hypothetical protein
VSPVDPWKTKVNNTVPVTVQLSHPAPAAIENT